MLFNVLIVFFVIYVTIICLNFIIGKITYIGCNIIFVNLVLRSLMRY